ncbi:MAG: peptidylprolyl isomerase [Sphingobacterium sp.]|nr:peptidylprolyl isomerase [Sphingobacterium sp.]
MTFELFEADAPKTAAQFQALVRKGFYDGKDFYRVVRGHVIQTGAGTRPSCRPNSTPGRTSSAPWAWAGPATNGSGDSEFYVCVAARPYLDGKYTVFGRLVEGAAVLEKIAVVPVEEKWEGPGRAMAMHKPVEPVVIRRARIEARAGPRRPWSRRFPLIRGLVVRYFYKDPAAAERFYGRTLGLPQAGPGPVPALRDGLPARSPRSPRPEPTPVPRRRPRSRSSRDEVDGWYAYLKSAGVAIVHELKDASRHPTRGFVAVDPEGYLLEFEAFLDRPAELRVCRTPWPRSSRSAPPPDGEIGAARGSCGSRPTSSGSITGTSRRPACSPSTSSAPASSSTRASPRS